MNTLHLDDDQVELVARIVQDNIGKERAENIANMVQEMQGMAKRNVLSTQAYVDVVANYSRLEEAIDTVEKLFEDKI